MVPLRSAGRPPGPKIEALKLRASILGIVGTITGSSNFLEDVELINKY
jgi:hypothetical protein